MGRINIKKNFGDLISISSRYRLYIFLLILVFLAVIPLRAIEALPYISICAALFGEYCYSIGITRGVSALLKGDVSLAITYNPLSIGVVIVMIGIIVYDIQKRFLKNNLT